MGRSILAVVAGFVVVGILVALSSMGILAAFPAYFDARGGTTHTGLLLFMQLYVAVYAIFGGWLAARLAPSRPLRHALVVGVLGIVVNVVSAIQGWDLYPAWANVAGVLTALPWAVLGGMIRERQLAASAPSRSMATA